MCLSIAAAANINILVLLGASVDLSANRKHAGIFYTTKQNFILGVSVKRDTDLVIDIPNTLSFHVLQIVSL